MRFVIGRAGCGKTHHCLHSIREKLRQNPVDGPRLIFLVPEQASQQMERAILLPSDPAESPIAASHRAEVFSFQRLAARLIESSAAVPAQTLSDSARVMVLRHLAAEHATQLRFYRRVQKYAGFLERLSVSIAEFIEEGIMPDQLASHGEENGANPRSAAKFHDLKVLYDAYLRFLGRDLLDPTQMLRLARARIPHCGWLRGAEIWMDGFASLSGEEIATLLELARHARHTQIAVLLDPSLARGKAASAALSMFHRTAKTFQELDQAFRNAGQTVEDPMVLAPPTPPRFAREPALAHLEKNLFAGPPLLNRENQNLARPKSISLVELSTRRLEVEYAVSQICQWTRSNSPRYRYRDIAIIVRDLEPYYDLIRSALDDRAIACFLDRRRSIAHHPLVEFLRVAVKLPVEGLSLELARLLLKTGLLPISSESRDELENYLLAHGIADWKLWTAGDWVYQKIGRLKNYRDQENQWQRQSLERVNRARQVVIHSLGNWLEFAAKLSGHSGQDWSEALRKWLADLNVPSTLAAWASAAGQHGDLDQAAEHEQTWSEIEKLLESITVAFGERALSAEEFAEVVDAGLSSLSLGLVPPTVDQVLVGSIERTRHPDSKAAILLGFNEGIFPARIDEDSILNDDDRKLLVDAGLRIGPPARQRLRDESMLVYIALTRASHQLIVTYARADEQGNELRPSPFIKELLAACPGLDTTVVPDPVRGRAVWDLHTQGDLCRRLISEFSTRPPCAEDRKAVRGQWNQLYSRVREELAGDPLAALSFSSLCTPPAIKVSASSLSRLIKGPLQASVSSLETYATCPFKYFAEKILRLQERDESSLADVDVGKVHHTILEEFARELVDRNQGVAHLADDEFAESLRTSCRRAADRLKTVEGLSTARDAYLLRRSASRLGRILQAQKRATGNGAVRTKAAELPFGYATEPKSLPALQITTPKGRTVSLRGYIDRVDLAEVADELLGIVVDYKETRDKKLDYARVYHGLSLQLLGYLLVLAEHGHTLTGRPVRPAGALFASLAPRYHVVCHPDSEPTREVKLDGTYLARGLLHDAYLSNVGIESPASAWSPFHSIYRNKDGNLGRIDSNDAVDGPAFDAMLQQTRQRMGELADGILDGSMPIRPYRLGTFSPCSWCRMPVVCRFESGLCDVQYLETLKRSEIYVRLGGVTKPRQEQEA